MTSKKLVAVTPAKDEELFIEKCVTSVLNQTYSVTLHLMVDDGSQDRTRSIVEKIMLRTDRVKIKPSGLKNKSKEHGLRPHVVQQIGINEITNLVPDWNYLLLLDADCWIPSKYCEVIIKLMEQNTRIVMAGARYLRTPKNLEQAGENHVRSANHIIKREFYDKSVQAGFNYATLHGEILLERFAWVNVLRTCTLPIIAYCGRETGMTVTNPLIKGEYDYRLGKPILILLLSLGKPSIEKIMHILGWTIAKLRGEKRYFNSQQNRILRRYLLTQFLR